MQRVEAGPGINPSTQRDSLRALLQSKAYEIDTSYGKLNQALGGINIHKLAETFSIPNLSLSQIISENPLASPVLFFVGRRDGKAQATIELAQEESEISEEKRSLYLRVAGIDRESNRVIAATFNCTRRNLTRLSIGVSREELFPNFEVARRLRISLSDLAVPSPTRIDNPYQTAGFITPEMLDAVDPNRRSALQIQIARGEKSAFINFGTTNVSKERRRKINEYARHSVGLYGRLSNGWFTTGIRREDTKWEIIVPSKI